MWVPIVVLIMLFFETDKNLLLSLLIIFIIIHHTVGSIAGVAWLSWISNLIPAVIRGRFFGLRNSLLGIITISATILGGYFLDWYKIKYPDNPDSYPFLIIFTLAILAGLISLALLSRQPDMEESSKGTFSIKSILSEPLKHDPFKRMIRFGTIWSFAVNFASPFYLIYMLKDLHLSYTLVSTVIICSAIADLIGMGFWGNFSDKHGNRPVIIISAATVSILPLIWLFTGSSTFLVLILIPFLHLAGGFFFAGYNLCSINMVFGMAPRQNNSMFIALWSMANGVAAGLGAISGGFFAVQMKSLFTDMPFGWNSVFKAVFLLSALMRIVSIFVLRKVPESRSVSVSSAVRILRNVRTWSTTMGYHPILQFFLPGKSKENGAFDEQDLWPLWKTAHTSLSKEIQPEK
jgi:MFS family permease